MAGLEAEETKITAIVLLRFVDVRTKYEPKPCNRETMCLFLKTHEPTLLVMAFLALTLKSHYLMLWKCLL
jgi:hypothetical protein